MKAILLIAAALCSLFTAFNPAFAQGTAFTYQGRLNDGGSPASGSYDLTFTIYDSTNIPGNVIVGPITNSATLVSNGLFTTTLDFGSNVFNGNAAWLEIGVRTNGNAAFATLSPRHQLTPTPYAMFANTASNLSGTVSVSQLSGTIPSAQLPASIITNGASGINISGTFTGNGSGLTNVGGATAGNYVYAYDTTTQQAIIGFYFYKFNSVIQTNGWYYSTNGTFTASQTGLYLIQYNASAVNISGSTNSYTQMEIMLDSVDLAGSESTTYIPTSNISAPVISYVSKSLIANINTGQKLSLYGDSYNSELFSYGGDPSVSITIVRIQ